MPAGQRERLERVCRYALRPPVARARLSVTGDGHVVLHLRHRWADGTTHLAFDPLEFLGRLAVLVPRPRINLIVYHAVLAPLAAWHAAVVRRETSQGGRLRLIALTDQAAVIQRIVRHLGLPTEIPLPCSARAPPLPFDRSASPMDDASAALDPCS